MLSVPYISQPDPNACALASYTMVAQYFFPETTLEKVAKLSEWEPGYVVWSFKFWRWMLDQFYFENSKDLESHRTDIKAVFDHKNFTLHSNGPRFEDLEHALALNNVCEVVLDSRTLRSRPGFALHRVVVLGFEGDAMVFHDPSTTFGGPACRISIELFKKVWLQAVSEPELAVYIRAR